MTLEDFSTPVEVDDVNYAFPAHVIGKLIPEMGDLPEEFRSQRHELCKIAQNAFFNGFGEFQPGTLKESIDPIKAHRHFSSVLRSYEPRHEHKIAAAGWLLSQWLK